MKVKGTITEVKHVEVEVSLAEINKAAYNLSTDQLLTVMKQKLIDKMKQNDPSLVNAQLSWNCTEWEVYDFYDSHKGEDYYKRFRLVTDHERFMLETYNDFAAQFKTQ